MPRHKKNRSAERTATPQPASARSWPLQQIGLLLVLLTTFLVYLPALGGKVLWDDDANMTRPDLQPLGGLYRIWFEPGATQQYYPMLHSAFWLEHRLWGDSTFGYHAVNLLWHMLSVVLVYLIVSRLKIPGALLAAAIFALHPVMVESVAWITEQKNTLSTVFYLSAILNYIQFDRSRKTSRYLAALGLFVLALCSKTAIVTLPAALLVIFWWQRGTLSWRRDVAPLTPFFLVSSVAGLITCWVEWNHVGAIGSNFEFSFLQRILLAGRAIWFYLSKLMWPSNLIFMYPRWTPDLAQWWQWIFPLAVIAVTFALWTVRKRSRAPLAAWLFYCGTLFPMLPFLNQYLFLFTFVSDHFQYPASLGMIVLAAAGIAMAVSRLAPPARYAMAALCVAGLGVLALLSRQQTYMYADAVTLYRTTLARNPDCWMAHSNLGELIVETNREEAIAHYQAALRLRPEYPEALSNMAYTFMQSGRWPEAIECLQHALRVKPEFATARNNLAVVYFQSGDMSNATEQILLALRFNPDDANAHARYAIILSLAGKIDDAIAHYKEAVRIRPDFVEAHKQLAEVLRKRGKLQEAIEHYEAALQYEPEAIEIYANLAAAFASLNQPQQAMATAAKAIETARAIHQEESAKRFEDWLRRYQEELHRAGASPVPK
jgi:tetratricopeptide (TPR) repeat protein